jgi:hypothetical protein
VTLPRRALLALPALAGCAAPLPDLAEPGAGAEALLRASAEAHGLAAFRRLRDISVSYAGEWPPIIDRLQPVLVDRGFRVTSEERLLPCLGLVAQAHRGPEGAKQVIRRSAPPPRGEVRVWFNGEESAEEERRAAAALVADGYALFLLGPMLLAGGWATQRGLVVAPAGTERITLDDRRVECDVLRADVAPGIGFAPSERLALWIDREERLMRRVRFSLDGLASTRGAVAEVDCHDHVARGGVRWPTRFRERLLRPLPLRVHDWRLTGLDLDRGITAEEVGGVAFAGRAAAPAGPI